MQIQNGEAAFSNVVDCLTKKNYNIINTLEINNGRYRIVETDKETFLIVFKKEFFKSFGVIFKDKGESGVGETLNRNDLISANKGGARSIIFTYPNGHIYKLSIEEFLIYGHKRIIGEGKETISINIKHLHRMNPEQEALE